jgi:photosystem II stability/assembly factor-like uncharacterized protein
VAALVTLALAAVPGHGFVAAAAARGAAPQGAAARGPSSWTTNGPPVTTVGSILAFPATDTVLVSSTGGLYRDNSGGTSWTHIDLGIPVNEPIGVLAADQNGTDFLAVGCDGVYRSIDDGQTWSSSGTGLVGDCVDAIAVDPTNGSKVYVGTFGDGVYESTDGGDSWVKMSSGLTNWFVNALVINPNFPNIVFAGVGGGSGPNGSGGPVFKSTDSASSWKQMSTGFAADDVVASLAIDPQNAANVYAGNFVGLVLKTHNGGKGWNLSSTGLSGGFVGALMVDPGTTSRVYAADYGGGIFESSDSGGTWSAMQTGLGTKGVTAMSFGPGHGSIFLGTTSGAFTAPNPPTSWTPVGAGLVGAFCWTVTTNPSTPNTVLVGTDGGVWRSVDAGLTWTASGLAGRAVFAITFDPTNTSIAYAGTDAGVFKSANGGMTWTSKNSGLMFNGFPLAGLALVVDPVTPASVYVGTNGGSGIYRSTNSGGTWTGDAGGTAFGFVPALAIDPKTPTTLYAANFGVGIYKTTNSGTSWSLKNSGLMDTFIGALAVNPGHTSTVYAGDEGAGVFKTDNGAGSWSTRNSGLTDLVVNTLVLHAPNVYVGTGGTGVFASSNGATSWTPMNTGLTFPTVFGMALGLSSPQVLHAGTPGGGVFDLTLGAAPSGVGAGGRSTELIARFGTLAALARTSETARGGASAGAFRPVPGRDLWLLVR